MGWAKYCEDNMSIYVGRMAVENSTPTHFCRYERMLVKKEPTVLPEKTVFSGTVIHSVGTLSGRRGLELVFQNGIEELEDELLLFAGEELDLFELALELRGRTGFASCGVGLASQ